MTERESAELDVRLYGVGYLVDGERIAPWRVQMLTPPRERTVLVVGECGDTDGDGDCPRCRNPYWVCPKDAGEGEPVEVTMIHDIDLCEISLVSDPPHPDWRVRYCHE